MKITEPPKNNDMGFLSNMLGATVKAALTPVAIVKDAVNVVTDKEADTTANLMEGAVVDMQDAIEDLGDGEVL